MISRVMAYFGLLCMSAVAAFVHAEDAFDGQRLFFTAAQRKEAAPESPETTAGRLHGGSTRGPENADAKRELAPGASAGERVKASSVGSRYTRHSRHSTARHEGAANHYQVYFTGLVTGLHGTRVLVNGLPCRFQSAVAPGKPETPLLLDCSGVRNDALTLAASIGAGELLVTDAERRVHRLLPGEGI